MTLFVAALIMAVTAVGALVAVPFVAAWAARRRVVDRPNPRSSHLRPTPLGGGVPVAIGLAAALIAAAWWWPDWPASWWQTYFAGMAAVTVVSAVDDVVGVRVGVRLVVHVIAAAALVVAVAAPDLSPWPLAAVVAGTLWIVGLTNAYNFMDGIDGLAGGQGLMAGLGWAGLGLLSGDAITTALGAAAAGGNLGFLRHNWQPARVFMGDVGATPLGFTFGALSVVAAASSWNLAIAGAFLVWPFLFDTAFTLLRRLRGRENVLEAHRSHLYQRLARTGWSHRAVTSLYVGLAATGIVMAGLWRAGGAGASAFLWPVLLLGVCAVGLWGLVRARERAAPAPAVRYD